MSMTFTIAHREQDGDRVVWSHGECDATFNVHNAGGYALLRTVGIEPDYAGSVDAAECLNRCVAWRATEAPARGIVEPAVTVGGGARMVEFGVNREYVAERVARLEELARVCVASGAWVGWA